MTSEELADIKKRCEAMNKRPWNYITEDNHRPGSVEKKKKRSKMWQKIKCRFGFHELVQSREISIGIFHKWRPALHCKHCLRGGDCL